jgi:organic radical activating enzyme
MNMNSATISIQNTWVDNIDNETNALLIYFMGCDNSCPSCHNENFKNPKYTNTKTTTVTVKEFINKIDNASVLCQTNELVFSGGDPLSKYNIDFVKEYLKTKNSKLYKIHIYTGHSISYVKKNKVKGFEYIKCGTFIEQFKTSTAGKTDIYIQFASTNQELYDKKYNLISKDGRYCFKE